MDNYDNFPEEWKKERFGRMDRALTEIDEIAEERADTLKVVKVDVDEVPSVAAAYGVMSIPTLMVFRGGETVNTQVGAMPKARIEAML